MNILSFELLQVYTVIAESLSFASRVWALDNAA